MNKHNSKVTVWAVRNAPAVHRILDVVLPAIVIGSMGTMGYTIAVLMFSF